MAWSAFRSTEEEHRLGGIDPWARAPPLGVRNRAHASRLYVASTWTNALDSLRPFRLVPAGGTKPVTSGNTRLLFTVVEKHARDSWRSVLDATQAVSDASGFARALLGFPANISRIGRSRLLGHPHVEEHSKGLDRRCALSVRHRDDPRREQPDRTRSWPPTRSTGSSFVVAHPTNNDGGNLRREIPERWLLDELRDGAAPPLPSANLATAARHDLFQDKATIAEPKGAEPCMKRRGATDERSLCGRSSLGWSAA